MDSLVGGLAVGGGLLFVIGLVLGVGRATLQRRAQVAEGTVTAMDPGSSGDFPIVTFNAAGDAVAAGRVVTFRSNFNRGYDLGHKVRVYYDPRDPEGATIMSPAATWLVAGALGGSGLLLAAAAAGLGLFLAPAVAERDRAVEAFLQAFREGDDDAIDAFTTSKAKIDRNLLAREVPKSQTFESGNSDLGGGTSCVRGVLEPNRIQITIYLVERDARWKVARAGKSDAECDDRLE